MARNPNILITRPISVTVLTTVSCCITIALCSLLYFAQYTQKHRINGVLVLDKGLIDVEAPDMGGIVLDLYVKHGEQVEEGQILYRILTNRAIAESPAAREERRMHLLLEKNRLLEDIERQKAINQDALETINREIEITSKDISSLKMQLAVFNEKINITKDNLERYEKLAESKLYSIIHTQEKRLGHLDLKTQKISIERELEKAISNISFLRKSIQTEEAKGKNELSSLQRLLADVHEKILEHNTADYIHITAPISGSIANILVKKGEQAQPNRGLLSVIPDGSTLYAELYASSAAIGFVKPGKNVLLRYRSYPYQKFGQHKGVIKHLSKNTLATSHALDSNPVSPAYTITVSLPKQYINIYGHDEPLQPNMEVDAEILLDRRRLYEWLFEPLLEISRK